MAKSLIGCEAVHGARGLRFEDRVLQPAPAAAAPCITAVCQEREKERERKKVRRMEAMQVKPPLRFDRPPRLDGFPMSWGTPFLRRDMLCLTSGVGGRTWEEG